LRLLISNNFHFVSVIPVGASDCGTGPGGEDEIG
jgi:hypothetical protein